MSFSNFLEQELLDHAFGKSSYTAPSAHYVQLHTGAPGEDGTSNVAGESTRQAVEFTPGSNPIVNTDAIVWSNVAASETYRHFSIWDAPTGGNCLAVGQLTSPVAVTAGDDFTIGSGDLTIALD